MKHDNKIVRFLLENNKYKGAIVSCSPMIEEVKNAHNLGLLENFILGEAFCAGALLSTTIKGKDCLNFSIECGGPIGGISVDITADGKLRGFIKNNPIKYREGDNINLMYGAGFLILTKYLEGSNKPYSSQTDLQLGSIAGDLTNYYYNSEQTPSIFILDIKINELNQVTSAFGIFLQVLPGTDVENFDNLTEIFKGKEIFKPFYNANISIEDIAKDIFENRDIKILETSDVQFSCPCSKDLFLNYIKNLPKSELEAIKKEEQFPFPVKCHNCGKEYFIEKDEIE